MNTIRNGSILALAVALALAASGASATNGYYTHGAGTKSKGQAGAGSANPEEVLALATNPAGIAFVADSFDAGIGFFMPMRDYATTPSAAPGACAAPLQCFYTIGPNDLASKNEFFMIPQVAAKWSLSDAGHLGLAFYGRGGMNTKWDGGTATFNPSFGMVPGSQPITFDGTFGAGVAGVDLMQAFLNLTYAHKFGDQFAIGASAIIAVQRFEARGVDNFGFFTKTCVSTFNMATGACQMPKHLTDNGHDMSYGYGGSVGLVWTPAPMFSLAAAYTTKMSMGEFNDYADLFAQSGDFDMPSTWTVGVALRPSDSWTLMFDVQEIKYSDTPAVSNSINNLFTGCALFSGTNDVEGCLGGNRGAGFGWEDMTVYKFGAEWAISDTWTWRAGYSTTDQPIPKGEMTFNILAPGVMEDHLTVGFTQKLKGGNELNLSLMYAPEVTVRGPSNFDFTQDVTLKMKQYELELSYSWKR